MRFYCKFRSQKFLKLLEKLAWNLGMLLCSFEEGEGGLKMLFTNFENKNGWHPAGHDEWALEIKGFNKVHQQGEFNWALRLQPSC